MESGTDTTLRISSSCSYIPTAETEIAGHYLQKLLPHMLVFHWLPCPPDGGPDTLVFLPSSYNRLKLIPGHTGTSASTALLAIRDAGCSQDMIPVAVIILHSALLTAHSIISATARALSGLDFRGQRASSVQTTLHSVKFPRSRSLPLDVHSSHKRKILQ